MSGKVDLLEIEGRDFIYILDSRHGKDFSMDFHSHDFYELTFVLDGAGFLQNNENGKIRDVPVARDTILLRDGKTPHRAVDSADAPLEQLIIIFDEAYLDRMRDSVLIKKKLERNNPLVLSEVLYNRRLKVLFREILKELRDKEPGRDSLVASCLGRLLVQILRAERNAASSGAADPRIERVLDYMRRNFFLNISVGEAAEIGNLSQRQFTELFKKETGRSFVSHLHKLRIDRAKEALGSGTLSITEIAFEIGYDDLPYFTRRFKAQEGVSPREYRKRQT